jgi:hypothetical protein
VGLSFQQLMNYYISGRRTSKSQTEQLGGPYDRIGVAESAKMQLTLSGCLEVKISKRPFMTHTAEKKGS